MVMRSSFCFLALRYCHSFSIVKIPIQRLPVFSVAAISSRQSAFSEESSSSSPKRRPGGPRNNQRRYSSSIGNADKRNYVHVDVQEQGHGGIAVAPAATATVAPKNGRIAKGQGSDKNYDNDAAAAGSSISSNSAVHLSEQRFADLPISNESRRALAEEFKFECLTVVQAETLPVILRGQDCLAKAKTGTGKTLAFLIPTIERLLQQKANNNNKMDIGCLIISPTRELAFQIASEAETLTKFHSNIKALACVGGTNIAKDHRALKAGCSILVATPGRLLDHLQNAGLADRLKSLQVLVMDEADHLLDMGFRPDLERILKLLKPSQASRQTLLFSATVPKTVEEIARVALHTKYAYVDTVGQDEVQTHLHVQQELMVAPQATQILALASILARETSEKQYKIIVFFTTARLTGFMAELFNHMVDNGNNKNKALFAFDNVLEIHSRKSQGARQRASDRFRTEQNAVLFSSDVSARGMDYPGVTFVLQVGLTERTQYIHRLGRTARAGKQGKGCLLLTPHEEFYMSKKELSDMPLEPVNIPTLEATQSNAVDKSIKNLSGDKDLREAAEQAYRAWLGYYNSNLKKVRWDKTRLVQEANLFAKDIGLKQQPKLQKGTVGKMGLRGVPGLLLE